VSAKLQGFDPLDIRFIRLAHELDLGVGDPKQIEILGYDINQEKPWGFVQEDTFASRGQKMIYHGPLKPFEKVLLQSPLVPWAYFASNFYHNVYWYPFVGRKRVAAALQTKWAGFQNYADGRVVMPGMGQDCRPGGGGDYGAGSPGGRDGRDADKRQQGS
jgi:hypothetical protein